MFLEQVRRVPVPRILTSGLCRHRLLRILCNFLAGRVLVNCSLRILPPSRCVQPMAAPVRASFSTYLTPCFELCQKGGLTSMRLSRNLLLSTIVLALSLCLSLAELTAQNPLAKNPPPSVPPASSARKKGTSSSPAATLPGTNCSGKRGACRQWTVVPVTKYPTGCSTDPNIDCNTDENTGEKLVSDNSPFSVSVLCPGEPPVCAGGVLSQHAGTDEITAYCTKYKVCNLPLTCRYTQPPRCRLGHTSNCGQRCTP